MNGSPDGQVSGRRPSAGLPNGTLRDATAEPNVPRPAGRGRAFLGRFVLAHFIAYPVAIVAAIGATPLALLVRGRAILDAQPTGARWTTVSEALAKHRVSATEAAQVQIVLDFVVIFIVAVFAIVHLAAIPWAIDAARTSRNNAATPVGAGAPTDNETTQKRTLSFRVFVGITAATLMVVAVSGTAGWLWLLLQ